MKEKHDKLSNVQSSAIERHLEIYRQMSLENDNDDKTPAVKLEHSPFMKQRNSLAPRGSENLQALVSTDVFDDFMKFARHYNVEHHVLKNPKGNFNKSTPLKHIINEFLNTHALERKCFDDLYVIMAFNIENIDDPDDTNVEFAFIGFVQHPETFTKSHPFRAVRDKQNKSQLIYKLKHFNKDTFDMLNLNSFDREVLFNIVPSIHGDFEKVKNALQDTHDNIDFDRAYICMFKLNNYLDVLHDGVYVSEGSTYSHGGVVVLIDPDDISMLNRICARFIWSYYAGTLTFEFNVEHVGFFNTTLVQHTPCNVYFDYYSIFSGFMTQKRGLEIKLDNSNARLERLEKELNEAKRKLAEEKQKNAQIRADIENENKQ